MHHAVARAISRIGHLCLLAAFIVVAATWSARAHSLGKTENKSAGAMIV
jgi:hypothetical protein